MWSSFVSGYRAEDGEELSDNAKKVLKVRFYFIIWLILTEHPAELAENWLAST